VQDDRLVAEFTHQAASFNAAPAMRSAAALDAFLEMLPTAPDQSWLDVACGPGIVTRALAGRVGSIVGVDLTPAMVDAARRESAGVANARFELADASRLPFPDGSFDGAVTRFSMHHIPVPGRIVREMARVVRSGGWLAVSDHVTSDDHAQAAWHEEVERLRDPSHWACLTPAGFLALGEGLILERHEVGELELDWEDWLARGSGSDENRALIDELVRQRPAGTDRWRLDGGFLRTTNHRAVWRKP
jgi:SAM-dependent methyltransferase